MAGTRDVVIRNRSAPDLFVHYDSRNDTYLAGHMTGAIVFDKDNGERFINEVLCDPNSWEAVSMCENTLVAPKDSKAAKDVLRAVRKVNSGYSDS